MEGRRALSSAAKAHSACTMVAMTTERVERETDERRLEQRRKQVEKGMRTAEYRRFRALVPAGRRSHVRLLHPTEPDPTEKMSARLWSLQLKTWRRCLHDYEPGTDLPAPYVSARWVHTVQKTADRIPAARLQECGDALERRARELGPRAALAALGPPSDAATRWSRARVRKAFQLLDQLDGPKRLGLTAAVAKPAAHCRLYELPAALCIRVASTAQELSDALPLLTADCTSLPVLGLDTEWVTSSSGDEKIDELVVLLQLSTESHCLLVRLGALDTVPDCLAKLLEDQQILKCGVSVAHDVELLQAQYALAVHGTVDLAALAHSCGSDAGYKYTRGGIGLNSIVQSVLGYHLAKDVSIRCGDWSADLTSEQVYYAACDAHAAQRALLQLHRSHSEATPNATVFDWCHGHAVVDRAIGRTERELMRSQCEKAAGIAIRRSTGASLSITTEEESEVAVALDAPIRDSPPLSAVRSPDDTDGSGISRKYGSSCHPRQLNAADQTTFVAKPSTRVDTHGTTCARVITSGGGCTGASSRFREPAREDKARAETSTGLLAMPKGRWGSAKEVQRQLFH